MVSNCAILYPLNTAKSMDLIFFFFALISEVIGTMVGFGSSTIFLPLASFVFDFKIVLVLVAFHHLFGNLGRMAFFKYGIDKNLIIKFGLPSILFTIIGAFLAKNLPQETLKAILGIFLALYSVISLLKKDLQANPTTTNNIIGGGISGFFAGLVGTGGALRAAFLTSFDLPKEKYIATAAIVAIAVDATRIPIYLIDGSFSGRFYWYLPILFIIAVSGSFIGEKIVNKIPQEKFKKLVLLAIFLVSIKFIYEFIS